MQARLIMLVTGTLFVIYAGAFVVWAAEEESRVTTMRIAKPPTDQTIINRINQCLRPSDSPAYIGDLGSRWSVRPAASVQIIKYDLASKKVSINKSLGAGASFHFYSDSDLSIDGTQLRIKDIKPECRATTFSAKDIHEDPKEGKIAYSLFYNANNLCVARPRHGF